MFCSRNICKLESKNGNVLIFNKKNLIENSKLDYQIFFSKEKISSDFKTIIDQNLNLFLKSKIIIMQGKKKDQNYEIKKYDILKNISLSDDNTLFFLKNYIKKVLQDFKFL